MLANVKVVEKWGDLFRIRARLRARSRGRMDWASWLTFGENMKIIEWVARIILGVGFVVFGGMYFVMPMPNVPPANEVAGAWIAGIAVAPHYLTIVKIFELLGGALVLSGFALPLGLTLLAPLVFNIVYYNTYLSAQPGIDLLLTIAGLTLAWIYRANFAPLFCGRSASCGTASCTTPPQ